MAKRDALPRPGAMHPGVSPLPGDFRAQFDSGSWERGTALALAGHVLECQVTQGPKGGQWLLASMTEGSTGTNYGQMMLLERVAALWSVDGRCDCPVGHLCKHQAAVLISFLPFDAGETVVPAPTAPVPVPIFPEDVEGEELRRAKALAEARSAQQASWLQAMRAATQPRPTASRMLAQDEMLLYRLQHHAARAPQGPWLSIWPGKATQLKTRQGSFGKFRPASGSPAPSNYFVGDDPLYQAVQRWMMGQSMGRYGAVPTAGRIEDAVGMLLLERVVKSGAAVDVSAEGYPGRAWRWGAPRRLALRWKRQETKAGGAQWTLMPEVEPPAAHWALADPALYLDDDSAEIGPLDLGDVDVRQLPLLAQAQPLDEDWLRDHAPEVGALTPLLPEPVSGAIARRIDGVAPVAHLRVRPRNDGAPGLMLVDLQFDYAGETGCWGPAAPKQIWLERPEGRVVLVRDLAAELDLVASMISEKLQPLSPQTDPSIWSPLRSDADDRARRAGQLAELALIESDFATLRAAGFRITIDPSLRERIHHVETLDIALGDDTLAADGASGWFDLSVGFRTDGQRVNLLPFLPQLIEHHAARPADQVPAERVWVSDAEGHFWHVPLAELRPWLDALIELVGDRELSFKDDSLRLSRMDALRAVAAGADGGAGLRDLAQALRAESSPIEVLPPAGLNAVLRPYQQQGLNWLQWLRRHALGGVLADDMGLGKTLQAIAHLLVEKTEGRLDLPALVVAPTSLVGNWRREIERFAPALRTLVLHGMERRQRFEHIGAHDVVVTTYPLLARDAEVLLRQRWHAVVLDEAQTIKNTKTQAAQLVQSLDGRQRLALTGTPMENHLGELWSLFNFLLPGYLASEARFRTLFRTPIEKTGDGARMALLRRRIAPFMLRRSKEMVASELPPKVESIERVRFEPPQANLYETIRLATETSVREALAKKGLARSHIMVLDALLKLRQVCCDPQLVKLAAARKVKTSAKMEWLLRALPEMIAEGRRVLVFSQFTSMLALIETALDEIGIVSAKLTGDSVKRDAIVERFTSGEVPLFLISLKAGGVGLNLPQADTVIHVDPWWNPAVETQATDRAHRLGQTQTVFVYKLVVEGTLEERILALQERKAALARGLHSEGAAAVKLTESDIDWLLQPLGDVVAQAEENDSRTSTTSS